MTSTKEEFLEILANYQGILHKVSLVYFKTKLIGKIFFRKSYISSGNHSLELETRIALAPGYMR